MDGWPKISSLVRNLGYVTAYFLTLRPFEGGTMPSHDLFVSAFWETSGIRTGAYLVQALFSVRSCTPSELVSTRHSLFSHMRRLDSNARSQ